MNKLKELLNKLTENKVFMLVITILFIFAIFMFLLSEAINVLDEQSKQLRATHTPTKYEYKVLSVNYIDSFWEENYYKISYIDNDNVFSYKEFKPSKLKIIYSNESKLVIENPEWNGYPLRNTLYWNTLN